MHKQRPPFPRIWLKRIALFLAVAVVSILALFVGYFIGVHQSDEELNREREQTARLIEQIKAIAAIDEGAGAAAQREEAKREDEIRRLKEELRGVLEKERTQTALMPQHEYAPADAKAPPPPPPVRPKAWKGGEPRLVIIIDDVSYEHDVRSIRSTGLPLVMSFLPPSPRHPGSAELARGERASMVHLPLEAVSFDDEEPGTLRTSSTEEEISRRIAALKQLYPNVRYMNNHTGSKFTADSEATERLVEVLKREGITFVDSRTTAKTKVPEAVAKHGIRYLGRDVFLDHESGVANVKEQIKEAVERAKRHGTAIAIGHPRPDTIRALKESKELLGEVRLVGIEQI